MTSEGDRTRDYTRDFSRLILDVLRAPGTANPNELLIAADAVLNTFRDGDDRTPFLRSLACRAMDWCVFGTDEHYQHLKLAARAFSLGCDLIRAADKIGNH